MLKNRRALSVLVLAVILLVGIVPSASASGSFLFYGKVYRESGWAPSGVEVLAKVGTNPNGPTLAQVTTEVDGSYSLVVPCEGASCDISIWVFESYLDPAERKRTLESWAEPFTIYPGGYMYLKPHMAVNLVAHKIPYAVKVMQDTMIGDMEVAVNVPVEICAIDKVSQGTYHLASGFTGLTGLYREDLWLREDHFGQGLASSHYLYVAIDGYLPLPQGNGRRVMAPYLLDPSVRLPAQWEPALFQAVAFLFAYSSDDSGLDTYTPYDWGGPLGDDPIIYEQHNIITLGGYVLTDYIGGWSQAADNVTVIFRDPDGHELASTLTNSTGAFAVTIVDPQLYTHINVFALPLVGHGPHDSDRPYLAQAATITYIWPPYQPWDPKVLSAPIWLRMGDMNSDYVIDDTDLDLVAGCFGCDPNDACWEACSLMDINNDDSVDIVELTAVGSNYGYELYDTWLYLTAGLEGA